MNPYLNRVMLETPDHFFGRKQELRRIMSRIGSSRPQSVSVVGDRRIGKSSLLSALSWKDIQQTYLGEEARPLQIYLDFQRHPEIDPRGFFEILFQRLSELHPEVPIPSGERHYERFLRFLDGLRDRRMQLVVLLDEFDGITRSPAFGIEFYSFLRSAANNYPVAYVTASKNELQQICHSSEIADSPFFNIFSNLYLRTFTLEEAQELIRIPSAREGLPLEPWTQQILDLAGLFPFYLQIACSVFFDCCTDRHREHPNPAEIRSLFLEEAAPHFQYFFDHLDSQAQNVLKDVALQRPRDPELNHIYQRLGRQGYLVERSNIFELFSGSFFEFLKDSGQLSSPGVRIGEVTQATLDPQQLCGRQIQQYIVQSQAGEGGMGVVYAAEDSLLNRKVALKICRPELQGNADLRRRSLHEARLAASVTHPTITSVYELFEFEGQLVIVMEWLHGKTLKELILEQGPFGPAALIHLIVQVCDGLEAAHHKGVIHRDIKPSNLMVCQDSKVKITDFGLAKSALPRSASQSDLTADGALLGTIDYMSPEQVRAEPVDHRSDLFSLGVVLFEGLTGKLPFQKKSVAETLAAIVQDPVPFLGLFGVEYADRLDPILRRLMAKEPSDRYQSAAEVRKDLGRIGKRRRFFSWFDAPDNLGPWR